MVSVAKVPEALELKVADEASTKEETVVPAVASVPEVVGDTASPEVVSDSVIAAADSIVVPETDVVDWVVGVEVRVPDISVVAEAVTAVVVGKSEDSTVVSLMSDGVAAVVSERPEVTAEANEVVDSEVGNTKVLELKVPEDTLRVDEEPEVEEISVSVAD